MEYKLHVSGFECEDSADFLRNILANTLNIPSCELSLKKSKNKGKKSKVHAIIKFSRLEHKQAAIALGIILKGKPLILNEFIESEALIMKRRKLVERRAYINNIGETITLERIIKAMGLFGNIASEVRISISLNNAKITFPSSYDLERFLSFTNNIELDGKIFRIERERCLDIKSLKSPIMCREVRIEYGSDVMPSRRAGLGLPTNSLHAPEIMNVIQEIDPIEGTGIQNCMNNSREFNIRSILYTFNGEPVAYSNKEYRLNHPQSIL